MLIPVLCNNELTVTFIKQIVHVNKEGKTILTSYRAPATKLLRFPHAENTPPSRQQLEPRISTILPYGTMSDTLNFLHSSIRSPTKNTVLNSIYFFCLHGYSSLRPTSPTFYHIQYPQHCGTKIKHGKTHILLKNQRTKNNKIRT